MPGDCFRMRSDTLHFLILLITSSIGKEETEEGVPSQRGCTQPSAQPTVCARLHPLAPLRWESPGWQCCQLPPHGWAPLPRAIPASVVLTFLCHPQRIKICLFITRRCQICQNSLGSSRWDSPPYPAPLLF